MLETCVKFVNNSRITRRKTGVYCSTILLKNLYISVTGWLKDLFTTIFTSLFSSSLSTLINTNLSLMNNSFTHYPQDLLLRLLLKN